jgi:hypothetical protein
MAYPVALVATHHDPPERLYTQAARMLPRLGDLYQQLVVMLTPDTPLRTQTLLRAAQATIDTGDCTLPTGLRYLGRWRQLALKLALRTSDTTLSFHFCDFDRVLHWVDVYPDELAEVLTHLPAADFTVLGRTPRAFASHPRVQRDTEALINHVFSLASGLAWDVTAASRGMSRRVADLLLAGCSDDTIGNDCSWPLYLQQQPDIALSYRETEGLEFETLDRFPDEIAAQGGPEAWIARLDNDPRQWAQRLEIARIEVDSVVAFGPSP